MYIKNDFAYAEPYRKLKAGCVIDYSVAADCADIEEVDCGIDDLTIDGSGIARWGGGLCAMRVAEGETYASLKTRLVKIRYSNDDQIAVMLNGDETEMERMQAWRAWAGEVARKIAEAPPAPKWGSCCRGDAK